MANWVGSACSTARFRFELNNLSIFVPAYLGLNLPRTSARAYSMVTSSPKVKVLPKELRVSSDILSFSLEVFSK